MRRMLATVVLVLGALGAACSSGSDSSSNDRLQVEADRYEIEQIEARWHQASSTQDLDLMMTLWADDATATLGGQTYTGKDQIRQFFATQAAPFQPGNHWVSETPAYKIRITVDGDKGTLYFECHYVDVATRKVVAVVSADQDVARIDGRWVITKLVSATPELEP